MPRFTHGRGISVVAVIAAAVLGNCAFSGASAGAAVTHSHRAKPGHAKRDSGERGVKQAPAPVALDIPDIGVSAKLLTFASHKGGDLPVPALTQAADPAWYKFTAVPGEPGNAVIVGHVDTYTGPGVFYDLYLLMPGDPVYVTTRTGRTVFRVTSVHGIAKVV
jgi:sortase (surface protein transpeptidase)